MQFDLVSGGLRGGRPVGNDGDSTGGQKVEAQGIMGCHPLSLLLQCRSRPNGDGQLHGSVSRRRDGPERRAAVALEEKLGHLPAPHAGEAAGGA